MVCRPSVGSHALPSTVMTVLDMAIPISNAGVQKVHDRLPVIIILCLSFFLPPCLPLPASLYDVTCLFTTNARDWFVDTLE